MTGEEGGVGGGGVCSTRRHLARHLPRVEFACWCGRLCWPISASDPRRCLAPQTQTLHRAKQPPPTPPPPLPCSSSLLSIIFTSDLSALPATLIIRYSATGSGSSWLFTTFHFRAWAALTANEDAGLDAKSGRYRGGGGGAGRGGKGRCNLEAYVPPSGRAGLGCTIQMSNAANCLENMSLTFIGEDSKPSRRWNWNWNQSCKRFVENFKRRLEMEQELKVERELERECKDGSGIRRGTGTRN